VNAHFLNPDIAMGKHFFMAAKQFDGTQRCYFIGVGSRIEQGSVMHAKGTNAECKASYKKEISLGNYDGTIDRDSEDDQRSLQEYKNGDSEFCGSRKDADQRAVVLGKEKRIGRKLKRRTSLTMIKKEDQAGITAFVREPRKCVYEVVLYGPEILLLGGGGSSGGRVAGSGRTLSKKKPRRGQGKSKSKGKAGRGGRAGVNSAGSASASASAASGGKGRTSARAHAHTRDELKPKRVKTLKRILREEFQDQCRGCTEKEEIIDRILAQTAGVADDDEL
jgi:hypothetical protein